MAFVRKGESHIAVQQHRDDSHSCSHPNSRSDRRCVHLCATKGKSKTSVGSGSYKVKEMASFLSIQLLEKVMAEAMKPEGESTMDLEVVERITKALQMSSSPSPEAPTAPSDSGEADDILAMDPVETTIAESNVATEISSPAPSEIETPELDNSASSDDDDATTSSTASSPVPPTETPKPEEEEKDSVAPAEEKVSAVVDVPEVVRKPLEIIQSGIPPLRPESIPQKNAVVAEDSETQAETIAEVAETVDAPQLEADDEEANSVTNDSPPEEEVPDDEAEAPESVSEEEIIDEAAVLDMKKAEESFRRSLLKQKLEYDAKEATRIESEADCSTSDEMQVDTTTSSTPIEVASEEEAAEAISEDASLELERLEEETTKEEVETPEEETIEEEEEASQEESDDTNRTEAESDSEAVPPPAATESPPIISERRVETIVALRQPKPTEEESKLAEKYANMESLEDRAYALLCDLGMIEEHKDPRDPSYDHSKDDDFCEQRFLPLL